MSDDKNIHYIENSFASWFDGAGWYFSDRADDMHGPYDSEEGARKAKAKHEKRVGQWL
jgi:hypothetical protein